MTVEFSGISQDIRRPSDGRLCTNASSRPLGTIITFTSIGDDTSNAMKVGGGGLIQVIHEIGNETSQYLYIDFNIKENRTYIHSGSVTWTGADLDRLTLGIVPTVTVVSTGTNTYFNAYGPLIIPAAGNGTFVVNAADMKLVEMPAGLDYADPKPAFWNADYSTTTHTFSNVTAAPSGNGKYNMFHTEFCMGSFVNNVILLGSGMMNMGTQDTFELGCNMRLKMRVTTTGTDHDWKAACVLALYRQKIALTQ